MKKLILLLPLLLFVVAASAQDVKRDRATMEQVQALSDRYLYASASADSLDKAQNLAVQSLATQIMTEVKVYSNYAIGHQSENGQIDEKVLYKQVSETFTNVRLTDYQTLVVGKPDKRNKDYTVFVYIGKDKVKEIYQEIEEREKEAHKEQEERLVKDVRHYYSEGCRAVKDVRIGDALKYWYWCYILSIGTNVNIEQGGKAEPAARLVESQIENLLNAIRVTPIAFQEVPVNDFQNRYRVTLNIEYVDKGVAKKVTNLDYSYNDGITSDQRGPRVRDGLGIFDLQYDDIDEVDFYITYRYDENETPPDIYAMVKAKGDKKFASATKRVAIPKALRDNHEEPVMESEEEAQMIEELAAAQPDKVKTDTVAHDHKEMLRRIEAIEAAIRGKDYASVKDYFTEEGYDSFNKLVKYGKATIVSKPQYRFLDFGPVTLCRSITMQFSFLNNKKQFIEDVTFRFNADNLIESLAFSLSDVAESDLLGKGSWDRDSRLSLMTFLEDYQTAYALGRIDYLERIFSEQALIIVGNKLIQRKLDNDRILITESVKYDTLSKTQYMRRLREHFGRKKYINLNFTDTDFERSSSGNLYGIRVRQEYFSDTYGDVGYLFLLVDLRFDEPIIHVRAWQNDKLPMEELFGMSDVY